MVSMLVIAIAATTVCGSYAFSWNDVGNYFEKGAEDYAKQVESVVETVGKGYEDNAEQYPGNAAENPDTATGDYMKTVKDLALAEELHAKRYAAFSEQYRIMCVNGLCNTCARNKKKQNIKTKK